MNKLWIALLEKRALSYLIIATVILYGLFSMVSMRRESSPEVQIPIAIITTVLPGAAPEDVETLITNEIEDAVDTLENVKQITSTSREGVSSVVVEFEASADIDRSVQKVRDEIAKVRGELPDDATEPSVTDINFADQPILIVALSSDLPTTEFKQRTDEVQATIESLGGVSRVAISGVREREVIVIVNKDALLMHGVSLLDVTNAIRSANTELPIGTIEQNNIEYTLALSSALEKTTEVADIPITTPRGVVLRLSDIATVSDGVANPSTISRVSIEGKPSLQAATLMVYKQRGADVTKITDEVKTTLANIDSASSDITTYISFDSGDQIQKDLAQLTRVGLEAVALVMAVLFATLGWREALIAGLSIPLSLLVSFIALKETGNTINFISLFSLILSIGILVDSAIVIVEAIHVNITKGFDKVTAARRALIEYSKPLTAGTLTTVAVFFPLFSISGVTGEFIKSIPFTVIFVLLASIVVALGMTPLIAALGLKQRSTSHFEETQEGYTERLRMWYKKKIGEFLDNRRAKRRFVWGIILAFVVSLALPMVGLVKATFFPQGDIEFIYVEVEDLQGTPLAVTDLHTRVVEDALYDIPEIESFTTTVGSGSSFNENASQGSRYASVNINLRTERERSSTEIVAELKELFSSYASPIIRVYEPNNGPPSGAPVKITFSGENMDELKRVTLEARAILSGIPGASEVIASAESDASEFSLRIDRQKAAELGVSPIVVAQTLRTAVYGVEATTIKQAGDEIKVTVKLGLNSNFATPRDTIRTSIDEIRAIPLQTQSGSILLGSILDVSLAGANEIVRHEEGERIMTVTSRVGADVFASDVVAEFEKQASEKLTVPEGITMTIGGENEDVDQSFKDMFRALILGVLLILVVLIIEFNQFRTSFLVLSVVPLSLIGVLGGLLITRQPISFPTMLGFIALAGVVVNHAIILVDVFNRLRTEHPERPLRDIVIEGGAMRLRPILLTKITSIIGLIPLLYASDLWQPIAVAMIFGLSFTGVLTLILLPALYLKFCKYETKVDAHTKTIPLPAPTPKPILSAHTETHASEKEGEDLHVLINKVLML
jgi:multidrug efflux pump subunit AcrB